MANFSGNTGFLALEFTLSVIEGKGYSFFPFFLFLFHSFVLFSVTKCGVWDILLEEKRSFREIVCQRMHSISVS